MLQEHIDQCITACFEVNAKEQIRVVPLQLLVNIRGRKRDQRHLVVEQVGDVGRQMFPQERAGLLRVAQRLLEEVVVNVAALICHVARGRFRGLAAPMAAKNHSNTIRARM